jgi:hypothetical protein
LALRRRNPPAPVTIKETTERSGLFLLEPLVRGRAALKRPAW